MKVYRVELMIVDMDDIGGEAIRDELENGHYGNDCISPAVMLIDSRDVDWSDDHPLNKSGTADQAFADLFATS